MVVKIRKLWSKKIKIIILYVGIYDLNFINKIDFYKLMRFIFVVVKVKSIGNKLNIVVYWFFFFMGFVLVSIE